MPIPKGSKHAIEWEQGLCVSENESVFISYQAIRNEHRVYGSKATHSLTVPEARNLKWVLLDFNQGVGRAAFFSGSCKGDSISLPFPDFRGFWLSVVCDLLPSSKPAVTIRVLFTWHHSDTAPSTSLFNI